MSHSWTKNAFWDVNNKKWPKWCNFYCHYYLTTLMAYLCHNGHQMSKWNILCLIETWITRNDVKGVSSFNLSCLITIMAYLCSERIPNIQINYFMFDCCIYRLFVLNRGWKRVSILIMIILYVCSTWGIVELKTRFETWITRNDVSGVSLFHLSYVIIIM
jgi:hypothetical protein